MSVIHFGVYHFHDRIIGYRNDYCVRCEAPRLALRHRRFNVVHFWFVPLVPLGWFKIWRCQVCGADPHARAKTRRSLRWAGTIVLGLLAGVGWTAAVAEHPEDVWFIWALRVGGTTGFIAALWVSLNSPPEVDLEEKLHDVQPNMDRTCALCDSVMWRDGPIWKCSTCGAERHVLQAG